jgi:hypothetical protein
MRRTIDRFAVVILPVLAIILQGHKWIVLG